LVLASALQPDGSSALGSIPQHVASVAQVPVAPPLLLPELEPLLEPLLLPDPLLEVVAHWLSQFDISQELIAETALMQLDSCSLAAHDCAAVSLKVPLGHSQLRRSLHPLSTPLSWDPHLLSMHDVHAAFDWLD
jgi:hypothetical protein